MGYGGQMGYLVGRDAPNPNVDRVGFRDHALSMQVIETYARNIESKHALFVFDACFAGSVFDATRAIPEVIAEKTGRPVRQFITSGTADQQVPDTSIFRRQFVVALKGEGDLDKDGYVTGAELGQFLETSVTNYSRRSQTPQYGKLRDPLLDKGDFVFVVPGTEGPEVSETTDQDTVFWQSVVGSANPAMYGAYLARFPKGTYVEIAKIKIEELKQPQTAALTPSATPSGPLASDIREAQRLLSDLGYEPGPADGVTGTRTQIAVKLFQSKQGLSIDGVISDALLAALKASRAQTASIRPAPVPMPQTQATPAVGTYFRPGKTFRDCSDCPEMVVIPPGSFRMGDLNGGGDGNERPIHEVRIGYSFAVGKYEVTQAEWRAVMGGDVRYFSGDEFPATYVSWSEAKKFVRKLSTRTGQKYRLLSESEWEYVARAGAETAYPWGASFDHSQVNISSRLVPVGRHTPNAFGLHDTVSSVSEWVEDCWHGNYDGAPFDGSAWLVGRCERRVLRGGSMGADPWWVRSSVRTSDGVSSQNHIFGFRVARAIKPEELVEAFQPEKQVSSVTPVQGSVRSPAIQPYKPGDTFKDCPDCPKMVVIPAGSFMMGSDSGDADERPVHQVDIGYSFAVGKYEVTQAEWRAVMGNNPSIDKGDRKPVEQVTWRDAKEFTNILSIKTGRKYRLLSESEWEYVARAGTSTIFPWGNKIDHSKANFGYDNNKISTVGSYLANAFGLFDVVGNVEEWTEDCWSENYEALQQTEVLEYLEIAVVTLCEGGVQIRSLNMFDRLVAQNMFRIQLRMKTGSYS